MYKDIYDSTLSSREREGKLDLNLFYFSFSPSLISFKETDKARLKEEEEEEEEEEEGFFAFQEFSLIRR